jgi:GntR family transcriptional regulator
MTTKSTGLAAYQRVAEAIKADIRAGVLKVGDRLPSNRGLAEQHQVALGTAQKALQLLESEGWVVATPAVGVFVNELPAEDSDQAVTMHTITQQLDELQAAVADLAQRVANLEGPDEPRPPQPSQ